ncbi:MAG: hypothetical protein HDR80_00515 [Bacteroides sp.]|nr:hypothetical protein [Bacteroides sp.]
MEMTINVIIGATPAVERLLTTLAGTAAQAPAVQTPAPVAEPQAAEPVPPTDEEMRTLMDIRISEFAGNGWKESRDPQVIRLRKSCTAAFKEIAADKDAARPTALQGADRVWFLEQIEKNLFLNAEKGVVSWRPF